MRTKLYTLLAIAGTALCFQANAKIWRLNNNGNNTLPLIVADFPSSTTLQQAHDNASVASGDTIHLEQSPTTYGACTFTKRLVVIGAGYFLNDNPKTQVLKDYASTVGALTIVNSAAAGSVITGLSSASTWTVAANNVTITRNYFVSQGSIQLYIGSGATSADGINVHQNFFGGSVNSWAIYYGGSGSVTNISIIGNFIGGNYGIAFNTTYTGIVKNNTILTSNNPLSLYNCYVVNNMTRTPNNVPNTFNNCTVEYNMGHHNNQFVAPAGTGNTFGPGNFTQAYSNAASWGFVAGSSSDGYYQLQTTAPGKTAGKNGEELGAFGSSIPYKLSGIATVPNIYAMSIAPISPGASSISVTVSAKSNN